MKKIAVIIAFRDFRDEEYFVPKEILKSAGFEITTVSTEKGLAMGAEGGEVEIGILLEDLNPADFDAVVFIGGPGALKHLDNENSYKIARDAVSRDKLLAAICITPVILAKAGVLMGKKAVVWSSTMDKSAIKVLEKNHVSYLKDPVVIDGKIITASGPEAARSFAEAIITALR